MKANSSTSTVRLVLMVGAVASSGLGAATGCALEEPVEEEPLGWAPQQERASNDVDDSIWASFLPTTGNNGKNSSQQTSHATTAPDAPHYYRYLANSTAEVTQISDPASGTSYYPIELLPLAMTALDDRGLNQYGTATPIQYTDSSISEENIWHARTYKFMRLFSHAVSCAFGSATTVSLSIRTTAFGGKTDSWTGITGNHGLAPGWTGTAAFTDANKKKAVSACMLAKTNRQGLPASVSLRSNDASSTSGPLPYDTNEQADFAKFEGAFFGDFWDSSGTPKLYACGSSVASEQENARRLGRFCANRDAGVSPKGCTAIAYVGTCNAQCSETYANNAAGNDYTARTTGLPAGVTGTSNDNGFTTCWAGASTAPTHTSSRVITTFLSDYSATNGQTLKGKLLVLKPPTTVSGGVYQTYCPQTDPDGNHLYEHSFVLSGISMTSVGAVTGILCRQSGRDLFYNQNAYNAQMSLLRSDPSNLSPDVWPAGATYADWDGYTYPRPGSSPFSHGKFQVYKNYYLFGLQLESNASYKHFMRDGVASAAHLSADYGCRVVNFGTTAASYSNIGQAAEDMLVNKDSANAVGETHSNGMPMNHWNHWPVNTTDTVAECDWGERIVGVSYDNASLGVNNTPLPRKLLCCMN